MPAAIGGAEEDRTPDLRIANAALSQLSYGPTVRTIVSKVEHLGTWPSAQRPASVLRA